MIRRNVGSYFTTDVTQQPVISESWPLSLILVRTPRVFFKMFGCTKLTWGTGHHIALNHTINTADFCNDIFRALPSIFSMEKSVWNCWSGTKRWQIFFSVRRRVWEGEKKGLNCWEPYTWNEGPVARIQMIHLHLKARKATSFIKMVSRRLLTYGQIKWRVDRYDIGLYTS